MIDYHPSLCLISSGDLAAHSPQKTPFHLATMPPTALTDADATDNNPIALAIGVLSPYLGGIAIALTVLHLQYHVQSSLRGLMKRYRRRGVAVKGRVLSCEEMPSPSSSNSNSRSTRAGSTIGNTGGKGTPTSPSPTSCVVEIMYERPEHRHHSNPRQQFRDTGDAAESMPTKTFVKRYVLSTNDQKMERGCTVDMLCLPENARSACPKQTVDQMLSYEQSGKTSLDLLVLGWVTILVLLVCAVRSVMAMDDIAAGIKVLLSGLTLAEGLPWLYCTDQYLKIKRRRFDGARPMRPIKSGKGN